MKRYAAALDKPNGWKALEDNVTLPTMDGNTENRRSRAHAFVSSLTCNFVPNLMTARQSVLLASSSSYTLRVLRFVVFNSGKVLATPKSLVSYKILTLFAPNALDYL